MVDINASAGIEGGEFHCYIPGHNDFRTSNIEEWHQHLEGKDKEGNPLHMEKGTSECIFCHKENVPFNLGWSRPGKTKGAVCDKCKQTQLKEILK